jgi:1-deoxy-D-xylulose-5-phosphate synthase
MKHLNTVTDNLNDKSNKGQRRPRPSVLSRINANGDIRRIDPADYDQLAWEIRRFLIQKISVTGGHLASNLGAVELTMALHLVFDFSKDRIVFDVGHQSYVHKILTGRKDDFDTLRQHGGLSGFPKRSESVTDAFDTGHASNSVSAALGMACARDLKGDRNAVIAVIGDGASTGGMFFEALNNAGRMKRNVIIVLNDNEMSISRNLSGLSVYLSGLRTASSYTELKDHVKRRLAHLPKIGEPIADHLSSVKDGIKNMMIPEMLFENFGVTYLGPIDGTNIAQMVRTFKDARKLQKAVLVHVVTKKGRGYEPAERHPDKFHGIGPFEIETGQLKQPKTKPSWSDVFGQALVEEGSACEKIVAITAAMADGTGLKTFGMRYPRRFYDVGIEEEHAVTFAGGLASQEMIPVVAIYSTFLQRAYDQILEDVCLQNLHVIFAVDRAGLVGHDGETHQGIFDTAFLSQMPNMTVLEPKNAAELKAMLHFAVHAIDGPVAIRYSRGSASTAFADHNEPIEGLHSEILREGKDAALFTLGHLCETGAAICDRLKAEADVDCGLVNVRSIKPMDTAMLSQMAARGPVITLEDNIKIGGYGQRAAAWLAEHRPGSRVLVMAVEDQFVPHGSTDELMADLGLDAAHAAKRIAAFLADQKDNK